jgi:hypothetical protein
MKKFLILFFPVFSVLGSNLKAQNYFNNLYSHSNYAGVSSRPYLADNIIEYEDGYLFAGQGYTPSTVTQLIRIDHKGDTLWSKFYGTFPQVVATADIIKLKTGFILLSLFRDSVSGQNDIILSSFNFNGDTIWKKRYGGAKDEMPNTLLKTNDGGYIIGASTNSIGAGNVDFWLIKTDSLGNVQWQKTYGGNQIDVAYSLALTSDDGYLLSGYTFTPPTDNVLGNYDLLIVKTDSLGDLQWQKKIGTQYNDGNAFVTELIDKTFLVSGGLGMSDGNIEGYLAKIDMAGKILWEKKFLFGTFTFFWPNVVENTDGTIILTGTKYNSLDNPIGLFAKVSPQGELIWERGYFTREDFHNYIYDIKPTSDGGYIFCGSAVDSIQKAWVVKTDCFGCDGELCFYPDSVCDFYDCTQYPVDAGFTTAVTESGVKFENNSANATSRYWDFGDGNKAYTDSVVNHSYECQFLK